MVHVLPPESSQSGALKRRFTSHVGEGHHYPALNLFRQERRAYRVEVVRGASLLPRRIDSRPRRAGQSLFQKERPNKAREKIQKADAANDNLLAGLFPSGNMAIVDMGRLPRLRVRLTDGSFQTSYEGARGCDEPWLPVIQLRPRVFCSRRLAPPPRLVANRAKSRHRRSRGKRDDTDRDTPLTVPSRVFGTDPLGQASSAFPSPPRSKRAGALPNLGAGPDRASTLRNLIPSESPPVGDARNACLLGCAKGALVLGIANRPARP